MCGSPLAAAPKPRQERKVVTVLFCDLVGFTSRAERLDPDDVRGLLASYHARVRAELERHGGTVEEFMGGAVMAIFGAPAAHEDDPERAVRAALASLAWENRGQLRRSADLIEEAARLAERLGDRQQARFVQGKQSDLEAILGR